MDERWVTYLHYIRSRARRAALRAARLAEEGDAHPHTGTVDGSGGVRPAYVVDEASPPWTEDDLRRFESLADGGSWREDDTP